MASLPTPPKSKSPLGKVVVIGGCGFLGHHIVNLLLSSYSCKVSVVDLFTNRNRRPDSDGVSYYDGDITSISSLTSIFEKIKPDVVIHTASPNLVGANDALYYKVNVEGTQCVIEACQKTGVKALVYTSSASVLSDTQSDLVNADERWPVIPPAAQIEYYSTTKVSSPCPHSDIKLIETGPSRSSCPCSKPLPKLINNLSTASRYIRARRCTMPSPNDGTCTTR